MGMKGVKMLSLLGGRAKVSPAKNLFGSLSKKTILPALSLSCKKAIGRSKDLPTAFFVPKKQSIPLLLRFYSFGKGAKHFLFFSKKSRRRSMLSLFCGGAQKVSLSLEREILGKRPFKRKFEERSLSF